MKKSILLVILLVALAACGIAAFTVNAADEAPAITYDGETGKKNFDGSAEKIFGDQLQNLMPGDSVTANFDVKIKNYPSSANSVDIKMTVNSLAGGTALDDYLILTLQVAGGERKTVTKGQSVSLAHFTQSSQDPVAVTATLTLDKKATGEALENQTIADALNWLFEATENSGSKPSGGGGGGGSSTPQPTPTPVVDVPELLDGVNHYAYIIGREDEEVKPEAYVTRAEVATIFFRLLKEEVRTENLTTSNSFGDVNAGDWYNTAISTMAGLGIVKGYEDGDFHPTDNITRAEFAAMCARFSELVNDTLDNFSDISGHWAETLIDSAYENGWVNGYEDGSFRPDQNITRAEAVTLINRVLHRLPESLSDILEECRQWPDNQDTSAWYYLAIEEATTSHDYEKKSDGTHETWKTLRDTPDWSQYQ